MYFSDNTVVSDETCEVVVKALVGGKFLFPNGSQLISTVYAISFARKLAKPVRLEMQHCALQKEERQLKYLSFVKAPMKQRIPPFEFSPVEGGSFYLDSQYGSIILDHFCLIGISDICMIDDIIYIFPKSEKSNGQLILLFLLIKVIIGWFYSLEFLETTQIDSQVSVVTDSVLPPQDVVKISYTGQVYYTHGNNANQWIARFMAVKNLEAFKTVI